MSYVHQGNFRAADNEYIDMTSKQDRGWLASHYPAIMADRPINMSEDYQFMPSHQIALRLQEDFNLRLVSVGQQYSRMRDPKGQEHFMKFQFPGDAGALKKVGDARPELVIMNSHNGRSVIRCYAGIFRMVCANGMVVSEESFGEISLRHFGEKNSFQVFSQMLDKVIGRMQILGARIEKMQSTIVTRHEENQLAKAVMKARGVPEWVEAKDVLAVNRPEDDYEEDGTRDLWRTFNVIQENLTSRTVKMEPREGQRNRSLRPLSGARSEILTNERMWTALDKFILEHSERFGDVAEMILSAKPKEATEEAEKEEAGTEASPTEEAQQEATVRGVEELLALSTYREMEAVTDVERASLSKDDRKRFNKRKSYLKNKEGVDA